MEYNNDEIEKADLKYLRISSWSSTPVPHEGLKWTFRPKIISTGKIKKDTDCIKTNVNTDCIPTSVE